MRQAKQAVEVPQSIHRQGIFRREAFRLGIDNYKTVANSHTSYIHDSTAAIQRIEKQKRLFNG